jgi:hypothetical protein
VAVTVAEWQWHWHWQSGIDIGRVGTSATKNAIKLVPQQQQQQQQLLKRESLPKL